jgi:signal transduction histidine kinase
VRYVQRSDDAGVKEFGVEVADHGLGMTDEQLARVGERFFRADKSGNIPGTGLGISIVKETLSLMGGRVQVKSEAGQGTQVTLWLPAQ